MLLKRDRYKKEYISAAITLLKAMHNTLIVPSVLFGSQVPKLPVHNTDCNIKIDYVHATYVCLVVCVCTLVETK